MAIHIITHDFLRRPPQFFILLANIQHICAVKLRANISLNVVRRSRVFQYNKILCFIYEINLVLVCHINEFFQFKYSNLVLIN